METCLPEVLGQGVFKIGGVCDDRRLQSLKLLNPPFDRQCRTRAEKLALGSDDLLDFGFSIWHLFRFFQDNNLYLKQMLILAAKIINSQHFSVPLHPNS